MFVTMPTFLRVTLGVLCENHSVLVHIVPLVFVLILIYFAQHAYGHLQRMFTIIR